MTGRLISVVLGYGLCRLLSCNRVAFACVDVHI